MKMIATIRALTPIVIVCTLILAMSMALANAAEHLPSDDDVNGILKLCAIGRVQRFEGDLKGKIEIWKRGAEVTGRASVEDLGALFQTIKPDPQSIELYKNYIACVKDNIGQYLMSRSSMLDADTVIKIVELQKYRPYLEAKLGPPAYVENYDNGIVEGGYSWKKIDLEIFYKDNMSIQYIFTVNDRYYNPNMEILCNCVDSANNTCLGCGNFLKYQGE